jgi:hypothetical protein
MLNRWLFKAYFKKIKVLEYRLTYDQKNSFFTLIPNLVEFFESEVSRPVRRSNTFYNQNCKFIKYFPMWNILYFLWGNSVILHALTYIQFCFEAYRNLLRPIEDRYFECSFSKKSNFECGKSIENWHDIQKEVLSKVFVG